MNRIGKARNARINQAIMHGTEAMKNLRMLAGFQTKVHIDFKDAWADARNSIEQLTQCFHEANAYNNSLAHEIEDGDPQPSHTP